MAGFPGNAKTQEFEMRRVSRVRPDPDPGLVSGWGRYDVFLSGARRKSRFKDLKEGQATIRFAF